MKLDILKEFSGHKNKVGDVIEVETDAEGVIKDRFWRRRFRDSARDECVCEVKKAPKKPAPKPTPSEDDQS